MAVAFSRRLMRLPNAWLLLALLTLVVVFPFLEPFREGRAAIAVFDLLILVLSLRAARATGPEMRIGYVLVLPAMALHIFASLWGGTTLVAWSFGAQALFHAFVVVCLLRYILRDEVMTTDETFAAAGLYVLMAFVFAYLYALVERMAPGSFHIDPALDHDAFVSWWELLYFSFTCLTTIGFGDIKPVNDHARSLVMIEPMMGVLYLALISSRLVAMQGRGPRIVAAIDARMGEVYVGAFTRDGDGLVHADGDERVCAPADAPFPEAPFAALGTGFAADDGALARRAGARAMALDATALPHAADLARLGDALFRAGGAIAPDHVEPAYLRDKVALTLEEQGRPRPAR